MKSTLLYKLCQIAQLVEHGLIDLKVQGSHPREGKKLVILYKFKTFKNVLELANIVPKLD